MNNRQFLQANRVFTDNKEKGLDISKPRIAIEQQDLEKLFKEYFTPGLNTKILTQKIFSDIIYYTDCRGKKGLRDLSKDSFEIKKSSDGLEYIQLTFNEKTKKNQCHENLSAQSALHNDQHIISAQPNNILCPVASFK